MPKPPVHEIEFIKLTINHQELVAKLVSLKIEAPDLKGYASYVAACWFNLACEHLAEAKAAVAANSPRSAYSRAYYAAYNASKSVRYLARGSVSLKGDDHKRAGPDLPGDIEDVETWSKNLSELFEHRLRADYDNWEDSKGLNRLSVQQAVDLAEEFVGISRKYMTDKYGIEL